MKSFMKEFKEFISRGNVMDMAVGIIIGGEHGLQRVEDSAGRRCFSGSR